jgi:uncharacterized protein YggE
MSKFACLRVGSYFSVALVTSLALISPALSQEKDKNPRTITVTGRGLEMVATSISRVNVGVDIEAKTAEAAQKQVATRSSAVVQYLKNSNVEKLQTTGISLNPVYQYTNNVQKLTGYRATNEVGFRVPTGKMGNILDGVVKAGATQINNISFLATDEAIATAQKKALQTATQDAQSQAQAVMTSLGLTRKEIVNITINSGNTYPQPVLQSAAIVTKDAATPVIGGEQQVEGSVTLVISY